LQARTPTSWRYDEKRTLANSYATNAEQTYFVGADTKFTDCFAPAYAEAVLNAWHATLKTRERARHAWNVASKSMTAAQATEKIKALVASCNVRGVKAPYGDGLTVEVERGWAVSATLYVRMERDYDRVVTNPDNSDQKAFHYTLKTEVSWSGTSRSIAEATASVKLYQELIELAAEIEATIGRERIVSLRGVEETVAETVSA
jgi:hypothetical protein